LNTKLQNQGFAPLLTGPELTPKPANILASIEGLLEQVTRRGQLVQELLSSQGQARQNGESSSELEASLLAQRDAAKEAEAANRMASISAQRDMQIARKEAAGAKMKLAKVQEQRDTIEAQFEALQGRLRSEADKEQQRRAEHEALFRQLMQRNAKPGSQSDSQRIDLIAMYEAQREHLEGEVKVLSRQVDALNKSIKENHNDGSPGVPRLRSPASASRSPDPTAASPNQIWEKEEALRGAMEAAMRLQQEGDGLRQQSTALREENLSLKEP